jgi:hypothetical protein
MAPASRRGGTFAAAGALLWGSALCSSPTGMQELVANGDFSQPLSVAVSSAQLGSCSRVGGGAGGGMLPFPSSNLVNALELAPAPARAGISRVATRALLRSSFTGRKAGWYRVRFFVAASRDYNGNDSPLALDVVGAGGDVLVDTHSVPLARWRGEWVHYDEHVAANPRLDVLDGYSDAMESALQLTITPGHDFGSGTLQITGISVVFVPFASRPLACAAAQCRGVPMAVAAARSTPAVCLPLARCR